ncbi:MAG: PQQ-binding-like beta-propeller repeat protein [Phycisphaerales bacterium]|nr:PQQ-binding-like beta-propeller repeat protein [Phycisphaerales bacterium]
MNDALQTTTSARALRSLVAAALGTAACCGLAACATHKKADAPAAEKPAPAAVSGPIGGYAISDANFLELGYKRDWTAFPFVGKGQRLQLLQPAGDIVLALETGSTVTAIETSNGAIRWANELTNPLTRFVGLARSGDSVQVSADNELWELAATSGSISKRQPFARIVNTPATTVGNVLVYGTTTGHISAHRTDMGVERWAFLLRGSIDQKPIIALGSGDDTVVGAVAQTGAFAFINAKSGRPTGRGSIFGGISTDPIAAQGLMIVAGRDQSLWGISTDGEVAWRLRCDLPLTRQPATDGTTVWCQLGTEGLSAVDAKTGKVIWSNRVVEGSVIGIRAGQLLVWNGAVALLLDKDRGDIIRSFVIPQTASLQTDKFEDGNLYAVSDKGVVVRFVPRK